MHRKWKDYKLTYEQIMNIDPKIRLVTTCDINGKIMYSDYRGGVEILLTPQVSKKSLKQASDAWKIRTQLTPKIGKGKYVLAEYEKVKRITMPLGNNHLLFVTAEVEADHLSIIGKIQEISSQTQDY